MTDWSVPSSVLETLAVAPWLNESAPAPLTVAVAVTLPARAAVAAVRAAAQSMRRRTILCRIRVMFLPQIGDVPPPLSASRPEP